MAVYKPKIKKTASSLDEVKFSPSVIDGLDKIAVRYEGDTTTLKTSGVYSVSFERDGNLSNIKSRSSDYDDVNSILIVGKNDDGDYFQMMFYDGKVFYRKTNEDTAFPYYWSEGISLIEGGGSSGGTTYTFASGTTNGAFTVTPSGGSAQTVSIHGLGNAAYKNYTDVVGNNDALVSCTAVKNYVAGKIPTVDSSLSSTSTNPVQNKVVNTALNDKVGLSGNQEISGKKNFTGTLQNGGVDVATKTPYTKLSTSYKITTKSSGTTVIDLSKVIPNYISNTTYQIYGQIFAYHTTTAKIFLYSDVWGSDSTTTYYIINTTTNSRCGSTVFTIPAKSWIEMERNIAISEFTFIIYGYRVIQ